MYLQYIFKLLVYLVLPNIPYVITEQLARTNESFNTLIVGSYFAANAVWPAVAEQVVFVAVEKLDEKIGIHLECTEMGAAFCSRRSLNGSSRTRTLVGILLAVNTRWARASGCEDRRAELANMHIRAFAQLVERVGSQSGVTLSPVSGYGDEQKLRVKRIINYPYIGNRSAEMVTEVRRRTRENIQIYEEALSVADSPQILSQIINIKIKRFRKLCWKS